MRFVASKARVVASKTGFVSYIARNVVYKMPFVAYKEGFVAYKAGFVAYKMGFVTYKTSFVSYKTGFVTVNTHQSALPLNPRNCYCECNHVYLGVSLQKEGILKLGHYLLLAFLDDVYEELESWNSKLHLEEAGYVLKCATLDAS